MTHNNTNQYKEFNNKTFNNTNQYKEFNNDDGSISTVEVIDIIVEYR